MTEVTPHTFPPSIIPSEWDIWLEGMLIVETNAKMRMILFGKQNYLKFKYKMFKGV